MSDDLKKDLMIFSCFNGFKIDEEKDKEKIVTLHETIEENNNTILDCYSQSYFKDILPNILKASRNNNFYNKLVKKGYKYKSQFFKILFKAIREINEGGKKYFSPLKIKRYNIYRLPEIEIIKNKKEKVEKMNEKKLKKLRLEKEKLSKYTEIINEQLASSNAFNMKKILTPKNISPLDTLNLSSISNSFKKKFNSTIKFKNLDLSPSSKEASTYYKSGFKFKTLSRNNSYNNILNTPFNINSVNYIYDKCQEEIEHGNKVAENFFKYEQKMSKSIEKKLLKNNNENKDKYNMKRIIEDRANRKSKYAKLEENNIKLIKKKINEKISDFYAFKNRKEFQGILRSNENTHAYKLYLDEMNKINHKMIKRRKIERKRIDKIETLCDFGYRKKEYLKNKIDIYNKRHKEEKKVLNIIANDDFFVLNKNDNKEQIGNLLPKLLSLRNNCLKEITVGNFLKKK